MRSLFRSFERFGVDYLSLATQAIYLQRVRQFFGYLVDRSFLSREASSFGVPRWSFGLPCSRVFLGAS